jgi:plastocyanin
MNRTKLALTTMLALIVSSISLVAVAQSAGVAQTVRVTETSYSIKLSAKPKPGTVRFTIRNASDDGHDFFLRGGGKTWKTRVLGEGGTASLTAAVKKGVRYTYWCSIGDHRQEGMVGSFVAR